MSIFNSSPVNGAAAGDCDGYIIRATTLPGTRRVVLVVVVVGTSNIILPLSTGWSSRLSVNVVPLW